MKTKRGRQAPDIYTPHGRIWWQDTYALDDLAFFETHRNRRLVFLTILAPETNCPRKMRRALKSLAKRVLTYCSDHGIPLRGYTEVEPILRGGLRPHIHCVIAVDEDQQKEMRTYFNRFYKAPYAIQYKGVYDLCARVFCYMVKGQHTYRDRRGDYTTLKLSQEHQYALRNFGQPIRVAVGRVNKAATKLFEVALETVTTVINELITVVTKRPILPTPMLVERYISKQSLATAPPQRVPIAELLAWMRARPA
jgi:hypothetical protein